MAPRTSKQQQSVAVILAAAVVLLIVRVLVSSSGIQDALLPLGKIGAWARFDGSDIATSENAVVDTKLAIENAQLRQELGLESKQTRSTIRAEVLTKSVQSYRQVMRVDQGASSGVQKDDAVLHQDLAVGKVIQVSEETALIMLLSDPDFRAAAIASGTKAEGVLINDAGGLIFDTVNRTDISPTGAQLVTSGVGGVFPPGLPLGEVGSELSVEADIFGQYVVNRNVALGEIRFVEIVSTATDEL